MNPPDYQSYSIHQLHEALSGIDRNAYSERAKAIESELLYRRKAGYSISTGSGFFSSEISFYDVALPIWWQCAWRYVAASSLVSLALYFLLSTLTRITELHETAFIVLFTIISLALTVYIGTLAIRSALCAQYKNFHVHITPKRTPPDSDGKGD